MATSKAANSKKPKGPLVVDKASAKDRAWVVLDRIVDLAAKSHPETPWRRLDNDVLLYEPDFSTLEKLLGVPLYLRAPTTSGVPALALDVWMSYELRRAGFNDDAVWPRAETPRILPVPVANLMGEVKGQLKKDLTAFIEGKRSIKGVTFSTANILGKNYLKQVDVILSNWDTGPELLISTKRMDSSYGNNAANRVEESYGDAKNLRLRHPQAALGFLFGLRSDILEKKPDVAEWLMDLLVKLGHEEDAYHATCLVFMEYSSAIAIPDDGEPRAEPVPKPGAAEEEDEDDSEPEDIDRIAEARDLMNAAAKTAEDPSSNASQVADALNTVAALQLRLRGDAAAVASTNGVADVVIDNLPLVRVLQDPVPAALTPSRFLGTLINRVLETTPVNMHKRARELRRRARS